MSKKVSEKIYFDFIGKRLKELRIARGFSNYEHLAYEIGISRSQYGRYENGGNMKLSTLLTLCNFLEITPNEFFKGLDEHKI